MSTKAIKGGKYRCTDDTFCVVGRGFISRRNHNKIRYALRNAVNVRLNKTNLSFSCRHKAQLILRLFGGSKPPPYRIAFIRFKFDFSRYLKSSVRFLVTGKTKKRTKSHSVPSLLFGNIFQVLFLTIDPTSNSGQQTKK